MNRKPDEEVSDLIGLYSMCDAFHSLPGSGGILDQDHILMRSLKVVQEAVSEKAERDKASKQKQTPQRRH